MIFDYTIEHTARKDNHIADALSRVHKFPGTCTTKHDLIPHSVDAIMIRPLQQITSNHINIADHSTTTSWHSNQLCTNMPPYRAINLLHIDCDFNKCSGRAETDRYQHSCLYLVEDGMEQNREDDYQVIKKADKEVSSNEECLSPIPEEIFDKYKVPSTKVNQTDR